MKVLVHYHGTDYEIKDVSKAMLIKEFRKYVQDATKVEPKKQTLMFGGKIFQDDCDLCDYKVEDGYIIHLQSRQVQPVASKSNNNEEMPTTSTANNNKEETKELSKEEQKEKLKELGALELLEELETEESNQEEDICKKCKNNDAKKCKVIICYKMFLDIGYIKLFLTSGVWLHCLWRKNT